MTRIARSPRRLVESVLGKILGAIMRVTFPTNRRVGPSRELVAKTDEYNLAAERYYADRDDGEYQIGKPFSDPFELPQYLFNAGILIHAMKVGPGDTVAEIGAGACWLSHFLNLYGCRTLAMDVSGTALEQGRERFRRDPRTRWNLEPQFLTYDGHALPASDQSCERIVLHDAYHHLPNQAELLTEMARILRPGGIVAMSEPSRGNNGFSGLALTVT